MSGVLYATIAALALAAVVAAPRAGAAPARGEDICPEENGQFQTACYLGTRSEALGFIDHPTDTDGYRFEALDANAQVTLELVNRPFPYRLELADWRGNVIASTAEGSLVATVPLAGSYWAFVDSPSNESSADQPYRLAVRLSYLSGPAPQALYAADFLQFGGQAVGVLEGETGRISVTSGRLAVDLKRGGTPQAATEYGFGTDQAAPNLTDFTLMVDTRIVGGTRGGYNITFRRTPVTSQVTYRLTVDATSVGPVGGSARLSRRAADGLLVPLSDWVAHPAIDVAGGVNRTVVRMAGNDIQIGINGHTLIRARDDTIAAGALGFSALTWAEPLSVYFDNILITSPGSPLP